MYASILQPGETVHYTWPLGRAGYIHVADTNGTMTVNDDITLRSGDGAFVNGGETVTITGQAEQTEFVLFDMQQSV